MPADTEKRPVEDVLEAETGGLYYQALLAVEVQSACERAYEEFRYHDDFPADVLEALKLVKDAELRV